MLIAVYFALEKIVLPMVTSMAKEIIGLVMVVLCIWIGVIVALSAVGVRTSFGTSTVIMTAIIGKIEMVFRYIMKGLVWVVKSTTKAVPVVYRKSLRLFSSIHAPKLIAVIGSIIITALFIAVII